MARLGAGNGARRSNEKADTSTRGGIARCRRSKCRLSGVRHDDLSVASDLSQQLPVSRPEIEVLLTHCQDLIDKLLENNHARAPDRP